MVLSSYFSLLYFIYPSCLHNWIILFIICCLNQWYRTFSSVYACSCHIFTLLQELLILFSYIAADRVQFMLATNKLYMNYNYFACNKYAETYRFFINNNNVVIITTPKIIVSIKTVVYWNSWGQLYGTSWDVLYITVNEYMNMNMIFRCL